MCDRGDYIPIRVRVPKDLAYGGRAKWKYMQIDSCIAQIVDALQEAGVNMRGSCCGHGNGNGEIELEDGRKLIISGGLK